jgi:superfamily II RNA helicase
MTATIEDTGTSAESIDEDNDADEVETTETKGKRGRTRDFTKSSEHYDDLAEFVNSHKDWVEAELGSVTPLQVKAILALKTDFNDQPEQVAKREQRKAEREAEKAQFAGMTDDQIKALKAQRKAQEQYDKLQAKANEALEKANKLAAAASGSAEDLQAVVEGDQSESDEPKKKRGLRR